MKASLTVYTRKSTIQGNRIFRTPQKYGLLQYMTKNLIRMCKLTNTELREKKKSDSCHSDEMIFVEFLRELDKFAKIPHEVKNIFARFWVRTM